MRNPISGNLIMLSRTKKLFFALTLFCALCCSLFLFSSYTNAFKYSIFGFSILALLLNYPTQISAISLKELKNSLLPWSPLFIALLALIFIHGIHGYSLYINALILYCLLFLTFNHQNIKRQTVIIALALNVLVISSLVLLYYFSFGFVDSGLLGINKNKLIPGITLLMIGCAAELLTNTNRYIPIAKRLIIASIVVCLLAIVISEVRTALLALISFVPLLLIYKPEQRLNILMLSILILGFIIAGFFFTGRMQQGFSDLENYRAGHLNTSWGIRLELWKLSIESFFINPIHGWGAKAFDAITSTGIRFSVPTFKAQHFHSDYFNMLASGGIIGIVGWLLTVVLLIKNAFRDTARVSLVISSLTMGLCERFWFSNEATLFVLLTAWLLLDLSFKPTTNTSRSQ